MTAAPDSKDDSKTLSRSYATALKTRLRRSSKSDLSTARNLGRRAMRLNVDTLELARIHEAALVALEIPGPSGLSNSARIRLGTAFFDAAVSPLEESHLAESESNSQQQSIIDSLTRRNNELAASNAELHEEVAKHKTLEKTLRTSETTSSRLLKKSREMQEELRFLWRRFLSIQEDDRRRISRELHDVVAQSLAAINVRLAVLRSLTAANAKGFHEKIEVTERLVAQTVELAHQFAFDLSPPVLDDIGLIPALQSFTQSFTESTGIPVKLDANAAVEALETPARTALYRIAEEALSNVARHAKASQVAIRLRVAKGIVRMNIDDDGQGFASKKAGNGNRGTRLGLLGMKERAEIVGGTLRIQSTFGQGTSVRVGVPFEKTAPEHIPGGPPRPSKTPK